MGGIHFAKDMPDSHTAMTISSITDVFFDQLKDLRSATQQTAATLPHLIEWAQDASLRDALEAYLEATRRHVTEIHAIFHAHSRDAGDDICKAMAGLIEGGNAHLQMAGDATIRNLLIIAHCNRIGHYLRGAAEFTLAMAKKCDLRGEADVVFEILDRQEDFTGWLSEIGSNAFNLELGGIR